MSHKPITPRTERVSRDAVTGELDVVVLDTVQLALERIGNAVEFEMRRIDAPAVRYTLARRVIELMTRMLPHRDGPDGVTVVGCDEAA